MISDELDEMNKKVESIPERGMITHRYLPYGRPGFRCRHQQKGCWLARSDCTQDLNARAWTLLRLSLGVLSTLQFPRITNENIGLKAMSIVGEKTNLQDFGHPFAALKLGNLADIFDAPKFHPLHFLGI